MQKNSTFPLRPGYERPERAADYKPAATSVPAARSEGTIVQQAATAMLHAKNSYSDFLDRLDAERHQYSELGYRAQRATFIETDAAKAVGNAVDRVRHLRDRTQDELHDVRRALSPAGDTAVELRATRYWNRTQRLLDSLDNVHAAVRAKQLIGEADRTALGVLLEELPSYLGSRGVGNDWIEPAIAESVPEYASALRNASKAQQALDITEYNAHALSHGFANGQKPVTVVDATPYDPEATS